MGMIRAGDSKIKLRLGDKKIKRAYKGDEKIYSAGNIVTYHVDAGVSYQEEVDEDASCLVPKTFTPTKSGWTFVGWRSDDTAEAAVYTSCVMGDYPITLYAVFRKAVTVTDYDNSTTAGSTSGYRYYNNGNVANPTFKLSQAARSGWTARGWSTSTAGNGGITYANGASFTIDRSITLYGMYQQTITLKYYNGSTTAASASGTRYYNSGSGETVNPTFTITPATLSGWTFRGWSTSSAAAADITYSSISGTAFASSTTLYAAYSQTITLKYYNGSTTAASASGTRYYNSGSGEIVNPTFTITPATLSGWTFRGWSTSSAAAAGITYSSISGTAFASSTTLYAAYSQTITLSYNGNGSTGGSTAAQTGTRYWNTGNVSNPAFTIRTNGFSRSGYNFSKWALGSTGGTQYEAGASVTLSASTTMYAVWVSAVTKIIENGTIIVPNIASVSPGGTIPNTYGKERIDIGNGRYYVGITREYVSPEQQQYAVEIGGSSSSGSKPLIPVDGHKRFYYRVYGLSEDIYNMSESALKSTGSVTFYGNKGSGWSIIHSFLLSNVASKYMGVKGYMASGYVDIPDGYNYIRANFVFNNVRNPNNLEENIKFGFEDFWLD